MTVWMSSTARRLFAVIALASAMAAAPAESRAAMQTPVGAVLTVSPRGVRLVQLTLNRLGYVAGPVNGAWHPETTRALANFQQAHGLEPSGRLNLPTIVALGLAEPLILKPLRLQRSPSPPVPPVQPKLPPVTPAPAAGQEHKKGTAGAGREERSKRGRVRPRRASRLPTLICGDRISHHRSC